MRDRHKRAKHQHMCEYDAYVACWLIRLSLSIESCFSQMISGDFAKELRQFIGISSPIKPPSREDLRSQLKKRLDDLNKKPQSGKSELFANTRLLAKLLQLNKTEQRVIEFAALSSYHDVMRMMVDVVSSRRVGELAAMLSAALDCSLQSVLAALDHKGILTQAHLLFCGINVFEGGMKLAVSDKLVEVLHARHKDINDFAGRFIEQADTASLTVEDFPHMEEEVRLMEQYLHSATENQISGVNILIYGPPGVGKTELVKVLAERVGKPLYQVKSSNDHSDAMDRSERLTSFSLGQRFLRETNALILFDEMEDVFGSGGIMDMLRVAKRSSSLSKAWVNTMLETNALPTIWVSNEVAHIDPAYLRRFDFSVEMGVPPIGVRKRIIRKHLHGLRLPKSVQAKYAQQEELSPAQIEKAAKVSRLSPRAGRSAVFEQVLDSSMALLQQTVAKTNPDIHENRYRLEYLNADCDLHRLAEQLKQACLPRGAMCFYGAPGTGKSALAHYLAKITERPLLARRASDILSPYIGVAEQNIAEMFKRAEQEEAILLLDEADTFLADRKGGKASWEVSQVNEMLTQMESFEGLFICSTNLMTRLDEASLRRFALKIRFDYLKPEQRWQLFMEHIGRRPKTDEAHCRSVLHQMNNLTPGDFACIRRQASLLGEKLSPEEWLTRLKRECAAKPDQGSRTIGFM